MDTKAYDEGHLTSLLTPEFITSSVAIGKKTSMLRRIGGLMKQLLLIVLAGFLGPAAHAMDEFVPNGSLLNTTIGIENLKQFIWRNRPIIVFADSPNDPNFVQQMKYLHARVDDLIERDVVVLVDTDPTAMGPLRENLRPRGFMLVLIGKDGSVKLRKPFPWSVRELSRTIDKMPVRQRELRNRRLEADG